MKVGLSKKSVGRVASGDRRRRSKVLRFRIHGPRPLQVALGVETCPSRETRSNACRFGAQWALKKTQPKGAHPTRATLRNADPLCDLVVLPHVSDALRKRGSAFVEVHRRARRTSFHPSPGPSVRGFVSPAVGRRRQTVHEK